MQCLKPDFATTSKFYDQQGNGSALLLIELIQCEDEIHGVKCWDQSQVVEWFNENRLELAYYESKTKVDYSLQTGYIQKQMEFVAGETIQLGQSKVRTTVLRAHDLEMQDSVWDPMQSTSDQYEYLQVHQTDVQVLLADQAEVAEEGATFRYEHKFYIDNQMQV